MAGPLQRFSLGCQTLNGTTGQAALEIIAHATRGFFLRSISSVNTGATFSPFSVGRPAAKGITPSGLVSFEAVQSETTPARKSLAQVATGWGTSPTAPTTFLGWVPVGPSIGAGASFNPSQPIYCGPGQSLVLWNAAATGTAQCVSIEIEERSD